MTIHDPSVFLLRTGDLTRSYAAIYANVRLVCRKGVNNYLPIDELDDLLWTARIISLGSDPDAQDETEIPSLELIEYALRQAASRLDTPDKNTVEALFGLIEATRDKSLDTRRKEAARVSGRKCNHKSFRSHHEGGLLALITAKLCALVDEQYLIEWEARLRSINDEEAHVEPPEIPHLSSSDGPEEQAFIQEISEQLGITSAPVTPPLDNSEPEKPDPIPQESDATFSEIRIVGPFAIYLKS